MKYPVYKVLFSALIFFAVSNCSTITSIRSYEPTYINYSLFFSGTVSALNFKTNSHIPFQGLLLFLDFPFSFLLDLILSPVTGSITVYQYFRFREPDGDLFGLAEKGDRAGLARKLDSGRNINAEMKNTGISLAGYAALKNQKEILQMLIERKAEYILPDKSGMTPLETAVTAGAADAYKILIKNNADYKINNYRSAYIAVSKGKNEIAADLISRIPNAGKILDQHYKSILSSAAGRSADSLSAGTVKLLLDSGADPNKTDAEGTCLIHKTAGSFQNTEKFEILKLLLSKGADPNIPDGRSGEARKTAMYYALEYHSKEAVELLRRHGAKEYTDSDGNTFLTLNAGGLPGETFSADELEFFLSCGIDRKIRNKAGQTAYEALKRRMESDQKRIQAGGDSEFIQEMKSSISRMESLLEKLR